MELCRWLLARAVAAIDFYALYDAVNPAIGDTNPVLGFTEIIGGNNGLYTATPG